MLARVLDLLDKYVDINVFDEKTGMTALMMAAKQVCTSLFCLVFFLFSLPLLFFLQGHEAITHLLLLHSVDVHKQDLGKYVVAHCDSHFLSQTLFFLLLLCLLFLLKGTLLLTGRAHEAMSTL